MTEKMRRRAVLLNDDPVQTEWLADSLRKLGLEVVTFPDGAEALRGLRGSEAPDLILVDLHMPKVDGWRFCRALRSQEFTAFNETPLLITSATFRGIDVEEITVELGANAFLAIPFKPEELEVCVDDLLAGRSPRATLNFLIVDPSPDDRVRLARRLTEDGYHVVTASNGLEALERLGRGRVDVVLMAEELPDVVGGDLVRGLKEGAPRASVVVSTNEGTQGRAVEMLCAGADATIKKPFEPETFLELVHKTLRERSILGIREVLESRTRELWSSEARYRTLFQVMPEALTLLDRDGKVLQTNPVAQRLLGATAAELRSKEFLAMLPPEDRPRVRSALDGLWQGGGDRFEARIRPLAGVPVDVEITGRSVEFTGRRALLIVARDLSERKRAEKERRQMEAHLQHVQRLESLGVFAGGIAHDFNNLLAGILGYSSLVRMEMPEDGEVVEIMEQIELSARRASELAEQILAYSGRSQLALAPLSLSDLVQEMGTLMRPAISKKAELHYELHPDLPTVLADPSRIRQIAMNLMMNASDSLEGGAGGIIVRTGVVWNTPGLFDKALSQQELDAEQYAFLEVEDNGCGMDEPTLQRIFDPFYTTKDSGRGLGLAATLGIVWQHGGAIEVQSVSGQGTTFRVWFPVASEPAQPSAAPESDSQDFSFRGGCVLVAEDEDDVRTMSVKALRRFGLEVLEARDGHETVEIFEESHDRITLVLLDLTMPVLDGSEALRRIREIDDSVPVVMTSGYRRVDLDPTDGLAPERMLWKPYSARDLGESIALVLEGPAAPVSTS